MFKSIFNITKSIRSNYVTKVVKRAEISSIQDRSDISRFILKNTGTSTKHWKELREKLFAMSVNITNKNIDTFIIGSYTTENRYVEAKSYIDYLKEEKIKLNLATIGRCFKLHYLMYLEGLSTQKDEENILQMYDEVTKEYPMLDSITGENIIAGLSVTREWKKCFKIFQDLKISCIPNTLAYNSLISATFNHGECVTGWALFQEMIENNRLPSIKTYLTYLERIGHTKLSSLDDLLENVAFYNLPLHLTVAQKIINVTNGKSKITSISKEGVCKNCDKKLSRLELTASEFEQLKAAFFENVIIGRDVFHKTTPEELQRFRIFVENMEKFDVIVDGLNVLYSAGVKQPLHVQSTLLATVIAHFTKQRKKVLVLGRIHMERFPKRNWSFIAKNSTVFLINNISQDDPYLLYCGLHSGINTIIVTRDLMRSHLYLLKDKQHKLLFCRWLTQSRYHLVHADENKAIFKKPLPYMITPQKDGSFWHVPYVVETTSEKEPVYKWLCINS
ncbi:Protein-only RNase P [Popillia japonica]|uniref:Mitochondrial ribonuclease P catalytic subunit n=1 Tax=Popillia japonica TaxID=7064 RepID=A0AAW1KTC6_POPJA